MNMPLSDLEYKTISVPADSDFVAVYEALRNVPGLEPQLDSNGNGQAVFRIDHKGGDEYILTYLAIADEDMIKATFSAKSPPPEVDPLISQRAIILAALAQWPADGSPVNKAALEAAVILINEKLGNS